MTPVNRFMSGRVTAIAVDPADTTHWLVGAAQGGIWETRDAGASFAARTDAQAVLSIGAIAFSAKNPKVVYAGTGEANNGGDTYLGLGLLKSTDGGTTWTPLPDPGKLFLSAGVNAILVDPSKPNGETVFAATSTGGLGTAFVNAADRKTGIVRSTDGGTTWKRLLPASGAGADATALVTQAVFGSQATSYLYAALGATFGDAQNGVYRSYDGGDTWTKMTGPWSSLPADRVGRIALGLTPDPWYNGVLYVSIQDKLHAPKQLHDGELLGLWRAEEAWNGDATKVVFAPIDTKATDGVDTDGTTPVYGYCRKQCFYDNVLLLDKTDPDTLWAGGVEMWKCASCSKPTRTWTKLPDDAQSGIHPDQHALAQVTVGKTAKVNFARFHSDVQICGDTDFGGSRSITDPTTSPTSVSFTPPGTCNPQNGTFSGSASISVSPAQISGGKYDPDRRTLTLDAPITVTFQGSVSWKAGANGGYSTRLKASILRDDPAGSCEKTDGKPDQFTQGQGASYSVSVTCQIQVLDDFHPSNPTTNGPGSFGVTSILSFDFDSFPLGPAESPVFWFVDAIYEWKPPTQLFAGNDGGLFSRTDGVAGWDDHNGSLGITQFYRGGLHPTNASALLGGSQDNGTSLWSGVDQWRQVQGGDGGDVNYSRARPDTDWALFTVGPRLYRTSNGGSSYTDVKTGIPAADLSVAPFLMRMKMCPSDPNTVLTGTKHVYKSTNFFSTQAAPNDPKWADNGSNPLPALVNDVRALAFSPADATCRTYAVGSAGPEVRVTRDGGTTWTALGAGLPNRFVTDLSFDPNDPKVLWVTLSGFDANTPGQPGHVFRTPDTNASPVRWDNVTPPRAPGSASPDIPANTIALDAASPRTAYAGLDIGLFRTTDDGATWTAMGPDTGMPNVAVYAIEANRATDTIVAFTHGRGAFELSPGGTADISVTKTASSGAVTVGQSLTYTIRVANAGPDAATNVVVTDPLPTSVTLVSATATQGTCAGSPLKCSLGTLANGASATITIVVTPQAAGSLTNSSDGIATEGDPNSANNSSSVTVTVNPSSGGGADLGLTKSHAPEPVPLGQRLTYVLTVRNDGPDVSTASTLTDTLPSGVSLVSASSSSGTCSGSATVSCSLGAFAKGASATVTIVATATAAGSVTNTASVAGAQTDPNGANNGASDTATVIGGPVITRITPASATQGTTNLDLEIEGANFVPGTVVSFQPAAGIAIVPPAPPSFGFVGSTEIHRVVSIAADAPLGQREMFVTNPDGSSGGVRPNNVFTITSSATPHVDVSPASLDFGSVAVGASADRTVTVKSTGTAPVLVRAAGATNAAYRVISPGTPYSILPGSAQPFTVRFAPTKAGDASALLVLSDNDPARLSVQVPLAGVATAPPAATIDVSPSALAFGSVPAGQSRSLTVTVRNTGTATLNVAAPALDNSRFTISPSVPTAVAPGSSETLTLTFSPTVAGPETGTLVLASNDASRTSVTVPLRGDGALPPTTAELATDDGTVETGTLADGLAIVNRLTPTAYPAQLQKIRPYFVQFQSRPNPSGQTVRLIGWTDPTGAGRAAALSTQSPTLLFDIPVTIPAVPAGGAFYEFTIPNGPTITSGDFYVGYIAPTPNAGVGFAADSNGVQRSRGYFSTDGGKTFTGPLVLVSGSTQTPVNMMIRATVGSGAAASACSYAVTVAPPSFGSAGGAGTLSVAAPAGCAWSASSSSPFVSLGSSASGSGNGSVSFSVAPNLAAQSRSGAIAIAGVSVAIVEDGASAGGPSPTGFEGSLFVPILLSTAGLNGSFFTSELTLTNRGSSPAVVQTLYTAAIGTGSGSSYDVLAPGAQTIQTDALAYLRSIGTPLSDGGNRGGTLGLRLSNLSLAAAAAATVRTTTLVPEGRAGLAYTGVAAGGALTGTSYLCGLRQNATDRSNLALMNAGGAADGDVTLRVTVVSGDPATPISVTLPETTLAPGGFAQISQVLASNGLNLTNGFARIERVGGAAPYYAYAVINDQANSDGSFVPPLVPGSLSGRSGLTLPVIVETSTFGSELVVTNFGSSRKTVRFSLVADAISAPNATATFTLDLAPNEQRIVPNLVQVLRDQHVSGIGAAGPTVAGALFATVDGGDVSGLFVGARTSSAGGGGRYGLFYVGIPSGAAASRSAWLFGLQQNAENRTNVALVNTGEADGSTDVFRIEIYDGDTGALAGTAEGVSVAARRFAQLTTILAQVTPGTTNAYAKVTRTSGSNPFITYAVINDGGQPGQRSGDGAFVPMASVDEEP